jgi:hypothetical protein
MINNIDSESPIPVFSEGAVRMVFFDEDTIYFETVSDDKSGTYNHFFRGISDLKYRARVTDTYYPERAGIPRYTQIQEERKRLEGADGSMGYPPSEIPQTVVLAEPEPVDIPPADYEEAAGFDPIEETVEQQSAGIPLVIILVIAGIVVIGGATAFVVLRKKGN